MKRYLILLIVGIVISGCAKQAVKEQTAEPVTRVVTIPTFAKAAVDAVGGENAWANTQVFIGECTAKFYRPDGTFYLTRQRHAAYPWSDSVRIYASEPQGTFVWQLSGDDFKLLEGSPQQAAALPITLCDPSIARALWSMMAAPASIATKTDPNTAALGEAVKVEGLWHYPLKLSDGQTWYLSKDSGIFDIYQYSHLTARGYDYRGVQKTGVVVPAKIEIFISESAAQPRRIIELNYHTLESVGF